MKFIKVTKIKSSIGCNIKNKKILKLLKLNKIRKFVILKNNKCIMGMINKINHIVKYEKY